MASWKGTGYLGGMKKEVSRLLKTPPPAWEKLYRRHGITSAPSPEQMVLKLLESTPSGASAGGRGKRVPAPPPDVRKAALEGLRLSHAHNYTSESGIGLARAVQLAAGLPVWERSIERMKSYFARHAVDRKGPGFGDAHSPSRGYMAWLNWGGDPGMMWASRELALENGAPGYQSWQWRQQDWRAVILKGTKIDYSKKCGGKGTKLPNGRPRLCLPLYVLDTLGKTKEGRRIIREQARKKEKAKRGQRVPWHPEIRRLHNKLEESIPEDDPRARRKNPSFKVGDRVTEGKRRGQVHAIHSKGTVDVLFDDMEFPIRRQDSQVRRINPSEKEEWLRWARKERQRPKPAVPPGLLGGANPVGVNVRSYVPRAWHRSDHLIAGGDYWNDKSEIRIPVQRVEASWGLLAGSDSPAWPPHLGLWKKAKKEGVELRPSPRLRIRWTGALEGERPYSRHRSMGLGGHGFRIARTQK